MQKTPQLIDTVETLLNDQYNDDIVESVELIRDEVYLQDLYVGRSEDVVNSGIVLSACRSQDIPISPQKIADIYDIEIQDLLLSYRHICSNIDFLSVLPTKWTVFLSGYADSLDITESTINRAFEIGQNGEENGLVSGRIPRNYAASCIYAALKYDHPDSTYVTQRGLSDMADVSQSSIRTTYKNLLECYN